MAQARNIDVILVTELTRWGRSMLDLFHTLQDLQAWGISLVAQTGLQFDLRSAQGKLIASLMAALAEFERDLLRERVRSGIAAARKRGVVFGRRPGQRAARYRKACTGAGRDRIGLWLPRILQTQPPGNPLESLDLVRRSREIIGFIARARFRNVPSDIGCYPKEFLHLKFAPDADRFHQPIHMANIHASQR